MHCGINRQEHRARLKPLQDLMQRPLVFCDKSMYRPLDNVTIKRVGLVKRDRPISRVLRARICVPPARPLPLGLCRLRAKDGKTVSIGKSTSKQRLSSPQTVGGSGGEKQRSYSSSRICHLSKSIRWPYHNTRPHMQQHADARTPPGVLAQLLLFCQLLHALVHASHGPAGRDADSGSVEPIVRRSS